MEGLLANHYGTTRKRRPKSNEKPQDKAFGGRTSQTDLYSPCVSPKFTQPTFTLDIHLYSIEAVAKKNQAQQPKPVCNVKDYSRVEEVHCR